MATPDHARRASLVSVVRGEDREDLRTEHPTGAVIRTASFLELAFANLFKKHGISPPQYNILRALYWRGGSEGLPVKEIRKLLINRVPDPTRLIDRLEKAKLVKRVHNQVDRRVVKVQITSQGEELLTTLDPFVLKLHEEQFEHLSLQEIHEARALLQEIVKRSIVPLDRRLLE